jgi:peptidoglycan/xylan/chitin deacetylase (PgdA/CDA1 family)
MDESVRSAYLNGLRIGALLVAILTVTVIIPAFFLGNGFAISVASQSATWDPTLGWDFECHTNTHPNLTALSADQIAAQFAAVNRAFEAHGYPDPQHTAYPSGAHNSLVESIVSKYRKSGRGHAEQNYYPIANWYAISALEIRRTTGWAIIKGWVDTCVASQTLLIVSTHDISSDQTANQYPFGCTPEILTQFLDYLVQKQNAGQLTVMTMAQAYDYWSVATQNAKATVVVSFDDAHETDYTTAYPLFVTRGLKGTSYIIASAIGTSGCLTWEEIATMRDPVVVAPEFPTMVANITVLVVLTLVILFTKKSQAKRAHTQSPSLFLKHPKS